MWNKQDPTLVFCLSKRNTEDFTILARKLLPSIPQNSIAYYHSGMDNREETENLFKEGTIKLLFATFALGMGFDKMDLRIVIHMFAIFLCVQITLRDVLLGTRRHRHSNIIKKLVALDVMRNPPWLIYFPRSHS